MIRTNIFYCVILSMLLSCGTRVHAQGSWQPLVPDREALQSVKRLEIYISSGDYGELSSSKGKKLEMRSDSFVIDGIPVPGKKVKIRGQSSLHFRRKSLAVSFSEKTPVSFGDTVLQLKKFYLNSLSMDRSYFRNAFAFACLRELGLFPLKYRYTEVLINGRSEGLYLMIERPEDYAFDRGGARYLMRRTYGDIVESSKVWGNITGKQHQQFDQIYPELLEKAETLQGPELVDLLDQHLDLDAYLRWLAFNFWVRNGDYTDEVFFLTAGKADQARLRPIAWDCDDIFSNRPHEGRKERDEVLGQQLLFSSESALDRIIARDPVLYQRYLQVMESVLQTLSAERLQAMLQQVYNELYPYFQQTPILENSKDDRYGPTNLSLLEKELAQTYQLFGHQWKEEIVERLK